VGYAIISMSPVTISRINTNMIGRTGNGII